MIDKSDDQMMNRFDQKSIDLTFILISMLNDLKVEEFGQRSV